jgi:hypothetical protein
MRRVILGAALLLTVCTTAGTGADEKQPKSDKPPTVAEELRTLQKDFAKAQQDLYKPLDGVTSQEEATKIIEKEQIREKSTKLSAEYAKRAWAVVEKNKTDDGVVDVLVWLITALPGTPEAGKAGDWIAKDFITNKKVEALLGRLSFSPSEVADKLFPAAAEKIKDPESRYVVRYYLANYLKNKAESIGGLATMDAETKAFAEIRIGKEYLARLLKLDPAKLNGEAEAILVDLSRSPMDVKVFGRSIKEQIENELFELKFLSIGKLAPDIEGEDLDGKKFNLREYRGKVVVIDFWGNW